MGKRDGLATESDLMDRHPDDPPSVAPISEVVEVPDAKPRRRRPRHYWVEVGPNGQKVTTESRWRLQLPEPHPVWPDVLSRSDGALSEVLPEHAEDQATEAEEGDVGTEDYLIRSDRILITHFLNNRSYYTIEHIV